MQIIKLGSAGIRLDSVQEQVLKKQFKLGSHKTLNQ